MNGPRTRGGFTLLELLIVIAIISLLAGLLVPAINRVQSSLMQTTCRNNLRIMVRAATLYGTNHRGHFPPALLYGLDGDANSGDLRSWDWWKHADGSISPGLLWQYTDHPDRVLQCPGFEGPANWTGDPYTGYNYNTAFLAAEGRMAFGGEGGSWDYLIEKDNLSGGTSLTMAQCRRTGTTAIFGIGVWRNGGNKFMRSPVNASPQDMGLAHAGTQGFVYRGATNFACLDGHVESLKTPFKGRHFDALPTSMTDLMDWPRNGFLSDDSSRYDPR